MKRTDKNKWWKREFETIHNIIKNKKELSHYDFLRIRNFKIQTSTTENKEKVKEITKKAFELAQKNQTKEAIKQLLKLDGIRIPIASTILAMKFPNKYSIIDRRVIKQLKKQKWLKDYETNPEVYEKYLSLMKKYAKNKKMKLRDYERTLFEKQ